MEDCLIVLVRKLLLFPLAETLGNLVPGGQRKAREVNRFSYRTLSPSGCPRAIDRDHANSSQRANPDLGWSRNLMCIVGR